MREYDEIAAWFAATRSDAGLADLVAFSKSLRRGASILELGCGTGIPLSRFLLDAGFDLYAVDSSEEMMTRFRANCPEARSERATVQESRLFDAQFDASIAWGLVFHLRPRDQERAIAKVARHLRPGGRFLFTAGDHEGTESSPMNGVSFTYYSLGREAYARTLHESGLELLDDYEDENGNYVYVARRPEEP
jgi:SAM-dependent methyltransferase